jgi:hypothetical protein
MSGKSRQYGSARSRDVSTPQAPKRQPNWRYLCGLINLYSNRWKPYPAFLNAAPV